MEESLTTRLLRVVADAPDLEVIHRAAKTLRDGGLVAFPTETVYGLGANALDEQALLRVFAAKGRPATNPMIVHVQGAEGVREVVAEWPATAELIARRFWPGPLTLVLLKHERIPAVATGGGPTVAVRAPAHPVAQALLREAGVPIAAPSANRSERLSPTLAEHVARDLDGRIDLILDGGPTPGGLESTVLDLTASPPRILRPGLVSPSEIEAILGPIQRLEPSDNIARRDMNPPYPPLPSGGESQDSPLWQGGVRGGGDGASLPSPGMMARHYAPRTPLEIAGDDGSARVGDLLRGGKRVGWLALNARSVSSDAQVIVMPADPVQYAAQLYAVLHELDQRGLDRIVVARPPDGEAWLAIRDRLTRAAQ